MKNGVSLKQDFILCLAIGIFHYNILKYCNLDRLSMKAVTFKTNIPQSFDLHSNLFCDILIPWLCSITFITKKSYSRVVNVLEIRENKEGKNQGL